MPIVKNQTAAAKSLGVSQARFSVVAKKGGLDSAMLPGPGKKKYWDTDKLAELWRGNSDPSQDHQIRKKQPSKKPTDTEKAEVVEKAGVKLSMNYHTAKTLNEQYKAARSKLAYEKEVGEVINAAEAEKRAFAIARQVRDACLAISDRCSSMVAVESDQFKCKQILDIEIKHILENLSNAVKNR